MIVKSIVMDERNTTYKLGIKRSTRTLAVKGTQELFLDQHILPPNTSFFNSL